MKWLMMVNFGSLGGISSIWLALGKNEHLTLTSSWFPVEHKFYIFECVKKRLVLSAKILGCQTGAALFRSLSYNTNRSSPWIEPYGTPQQIKWEPVRWATINTYKFSSFFKMWRKPVICRTFYIKAVQFLNKYFTIICTKLFLKVD